MNRSKLFVSAFSCMPHMGSEPGVGWHWIVEMSKYFELWVLVHKEPIDDIETYVKEIGLDRKIHFIYYDIPFNFLFFQKGKFRWVRTYYLIWTALSNKIIRKTMLENDIHIFHHLTFGNAIWPVSKYGQKQTFIWGPVGGVETVSEEYTRYYDRKSRIIEFVKRLMVKSLKFRRGFLQRCKDADLILCKTEAMRMAIPEKWRQKAVLFTDVAVENSELENTQETPHEGHRDRIEVLAVGRLDAWRGFDILLEAFASARKQCPANTHLTLLGDGMFRAHLLSIRSQLNLENYVEMPGSISVDEYKRKMSECDFVVNSCLKEGAVTVSFDSMRYGKPLICVDTGGYTHYFNNDYAIILPQQSRDGLIMSMSDAIVRLASNQELRISMGNKAHEAGNQFLWDKKGEQIRDIIKNLIIINNG